MKKRGFYAKKKASFCGRRHDVEEEDEEEEEDNSVWKTLIQRGIFSEGAVCVWREPSWFIIMI